MYYKYIVTNGVFSKNYHEIESDEQLDKIFADKDEKDVCIFHYEQENNDFSSIFFSKAKESIFDIITSRNFYDGYRLGFMHSSRKLMDEYKIKNDEELI